MPANEQQAIFSKLKNKKIIIQANDFAKFGRLQQHDNYYFLKLKDEFIHQLYPMLPQDKKIKKPDYFSGANKTGAHLSVIYVEENMTLPTNEIDKIYDFTITDFARTILGSKEYYVLLVNSTALTALRIKYNLPARPKYKGVRVDFHITVGVRVLE